MHPERYQSDFFNEQYISVGVYGPIAVKADKKEQELVHTILKTLPGQYSKKKKAVTGLSLAVHCLR